MAKQIPKKKTQAKAKAKKKVKQQNFTAVLSELDILSQERMEWVNMLLESSGEGMDEILQTMLTNLQHMQGPPKLVVKGENVTVKLSSDEFKLLCEIQDRTHYWIAMRCIVACAEWGIKIGNFKAPKKLCIRCGVKVKNKPKKKGKK